MLIPILVLIMLVILGLISRRYFGTANRPLFLILLIIALLLFSGLRHRSVGTDTSGYFARFRNYSKYSTYDEMMFYAEDESDPGFYVFTWAFTKVINNPQVWIGFISFMYILGIALVCYWESPDYSFSILYMYCMGMFFFSMTGLRQAFATGIALMSYVFVVKRRPILFLLLILVAMQMHKSALIFILIYPFANVKTGWARLLVVVMFFITVLAFRRTIGTWIIEYLPDEIVDERITGYMQSTTQYTASGFIIQLFMFVYCMRYHNSVVRDIPHREVLYNMAFFSLVFQAASMSIAEFFRVSMYFSWTFMILIPICMQYERDQRNYEFVRIMIVAALIFYFFYSTVGSCGITPYRFFWQLAEVEETF